MLLGGESGGGREIGRDEILNRPFTDFVRDRIDGVELTEEALDPVWAELRRMVSRELRRRGLWLVSPILLGAQATVWVESGRPLIRGVPRRGADALDELVTELWAATLEELAEYLARRVLRGAKIEPLFVTMIRQKITERQQKLDPLGWHFFRNFRSAIRELVESGELNVIAGDETITNDTVLAFGEHQAKDIPADDPRLAEIARSWSDELLALWATGRGEETREMVALLVEKVRGLGDEGFPGFSFKGLLDALKSELREGLAAVFAGRDPRIDPADDDSPIASGGMQPRVEPEVEVRLIARARLDELSDCVEGRLRRLAGQQRTRDQLRRLWRFHTAHARGEADPEEARHARPEAIDAILSEELPGFRGLGRILDLGHERVAQLSARLKDEVARCRELLAGAAKGMESKPAGSGSEASMDETHNLRSELRQRTAAAFASAGQASTMSRKGVEIGELVSFAEGLDEGIEWLVLPADGGHWLLVAADAVPWLGSRDFEIEGPSGPLVLRFGQTVEIATEALAQVEMVAEPIAVETLEAVAAFRRRLDAEDFLDSVDDVSRETDFDPDYLDRCQEIETLARALVERLGQAEVQPALAPAPEPEMGEGEQAGAEGARRLGPRSRDRGPRGTLRGMAPWLAAAALLAFTLTAVWLVRSLETNRHLDRRIAEIEAEREAERERMAEQQRQLEEDVDRLRSEVERLEEDADPVLRERLAAKEAELAKLESRHATEIAALEAPGLVPKLFAPYSIQRGSDAKELVVDENDRWVVLEFADAREDDTLEILTEDGREVWSDRLEGLRDHEAAYRVPSQMLPPGKKYIVRLLRGEEVLSDFELWIVRPETR